MNESVKVVFVKLNWLLANGAKTKDFEKSYFWTIFIPEFDIDLDLKMKKGFCKTYETNCIRVDAKEKSENNK